MSGYYILIGLFMLISMGVSSQLKRKFAKYSKTFLANGMSGKEIAEKMLRDHGITDVRVISTPGQLTDHYNPADKTVNLSEVVYHERNAAAAAVSAHECGHAVQHAIGYSWLEMRSRMVPAVNIASRLNQWILMLGLVVATTSGNPYLLWIGIALFAITTLFAFITLPVEYDASNRALAWLKNKNIVLPNEYDGAKDSLKWAARTYVVAAIGSLAQLIYFIMLATGNRNNN
ncbi:zinc metallopeptidase [Faecalibacter rhinopitheci]|uniref:Zinc metallopeptidase n=1 Tax=Faecalibacter rhinopitheci TaxID=2779678 RepID=A0A8J7K370_9FLAO|nr:zinc metallopeptidase [Faecalibacter rhinopitheci]MBF0596213.1 zinc metallopeptidase [Faecalibacter rhinopitheci]MBQ0148332.1 zinc metallopeptidase [Candidatus Onthonaster equi]